MYNAIAVSSGLICTVANLLTFSDLKNLKFFCEFDENKCKKINMKKIIGGAADGQYFVTLPDGRVQVSVFRISISAEKFSDKFPQKSFWTKFRRKVFGQISAEKFLEKFPQKSFRTNFRRKVFGQISAEKFSDKFLQKSFRKNFCRKVFGKISAEKFLDKFPQKSFRKNFRRKVFRKISIIKQQTKTDLN
jgi:hypothetical protein